ncbi:hypothetical protein [Dyadobacter psychrotolerans]|uniref:DUF839 domain-containing protein n=1 Tax=Dyadobacter psychrotolerans TaxID=2541721 RepID=A0A4R5DPX1_9BACT|nr:hypothetical protein [Dyadobacter psychrotolerans]TDE15657.1 hypothetical protein E0F88_14255 [Dyadobacter psychrotolerans]
MTKNFMNKKSLAAAIICGSMTLNGCIKDHENPPVDASKLVNRSVNPSLLKSMPGFESLQITTLISSDDKLAESPDFVYGAQPDGGAFVRNPNGEGFVMINNHEILFSVSRVYLDKDLKPVKGEYIVDAEGGQWRLCSATLATPKEHGFGPVFLTAGETNSESMTHAIDPFGAADKKNKSRTVSAFGKWNAENAVPLPKDAFPGKTVIIIGEDDTNGQLVAYVSETVGDLNNGKLYALRRTNQESVETDMVKGQSYDVEFVPFDDVKTSTGTQLQAQTVDKKMIQFARVEDIDYVKGGNGAGREIYFTATGVSQADKVTPVAGKNMWGRVYHLKFDAINPLKGKLDIIMDGADRPGNFIVNPDNICVTKNYVYVQEDGDSFYRDNDHDGTIWQYNIATKESKAMLQMNHRRTDAAFNAKYNSVNSNLLSSWEYGAMIDISEETGIPETFMINLHPHTWQDPKYKGADGSGLSTNQEGGQTVIVRGIKQ